MKGYYADKDGLVRGYWDLAEKPVDTQEYTWVVTDDLPPVYVPEPTKEEVESKLKAEIQALELKNLRKLFDGEDLTAVNAERAKLRADIQKLK
jgi:hypothetical protein